MVLVPSMHSGPHARHCWTPPGHEDPAEWQRNRDRRLEIWRRMATDLPVQALRRMHEATIPLEELPAWGDKLLSGLVRGRVVVRVAA